MKYFDPRNQNKVHARVCQKFLDTKLARHMAGVTAEQLQELAAEVTRKNIARNKKGLASVYYHMGTVPNGLYKVGYPKLFGGPCLYKDYKEAAKDEALVWDLIKAAVKMKGNQTPPPEAVSIPTVNVILMECGQVKSMKSWAETPEGNAAAEACFRVDAIRLGCGSEHIDVAIEDGFLDAAPLDLMLVHSS